MTKNKGAGRPAMVEKAKKSRAVAVRMTQTDYDKMAQIAKPSGLDPSVLVRAIVLDYVNNPHPLVGEAPAHHRVTVSDIPMPMPRENRPAHAVVNRASKARPPGATASSTALKRTR